ncbi:MAG: hypothetical protein Q8N12_06705 [Thermodesulfovibrionales bacterium]|nr:hypothetical protein [Thermodesulfovibrionales bacterium]
MKYEEELAKHLKNPDGYLWFSESWPHSYLNGIAEDAFNKNSPEGYLTSLIIYHQLTEEILRLLLLYSNLVMKAALYPVKIDLPAVNESSLGELLQIHRATVVFDKKSKIIEQADKLNRLRNELSHGIIKYPSGTAIIEKAENSKEIFENIFENWGMSMKWFYQTFDKLKQRPEISKLLNKYS